jgi:hypothetical protein
MDPTGDADSSAMGSLLRVVAAVASAIVIFSFLAFATEEAGHGSQDQVNKLGTALDERAPAANTERERERRHSGVREWLDDANDVLLKPFAGVVHTSNQWVQRIVPGVLALLVYGLGLPLLANVMPRRTPASRDWRTAG